MTAPMLHISLILLEVDLNLVAILCTISYRAEINSSFINKVLRRKDSIILRQANARSISSIIDRFSNYEDVARAMKDAGIEKCSLIFGIDYTNSNRFQGKAAFDGKSLHAISPNIYNPYQEVILYLGKTLQIFSDDGLIPAFGFGDLETKDKDVFPLKSPDGVCNGFEGVLKAYNEATPNVHLYGPTNFAPIINKAIEIVKERKKVTISFWENFYTFGNKGFVQRMNENIFPHDSQ